ncbi:MAG: carbamoyltransferase HypF [Nanoarchaeota archaeon]
MYKILIKGIVQGVGFRPYIYNLAIKNNIKGYIQNTNTGVTILSNNKNFKEKILLNPPKLSKIELIQIKKIKTNKTYNNFQIINSQNKKSYVQIPSDLDLCKDCLKELFDKKDYRYKYPFISCINCGPRYSTIKSLPYDRDKTTFNKFELCTYCYNEYTNPTTRRYHAQTIACNNCGPQLTLYKNNKKINTNNPIKETAKLLKQNEIIAIKGIGGFHLATLTNKKNIEKLKELTKRYHKPYAILAKNISMIKQYVIINKTEKKILTSNIKPIVLLKKKQKNQLNHISELSSLGFMLPSNPIQYLLFEYIDEPIILTSSNLPSNPITTKKNQQFTNYILDYNREISNFLDDSIIKVINNYPLIIRRSRGFVPKEIPIPSNYKTNNNQDIIGFGSELKNTICIKKNNSLILSQHIGNTYNYENYLNFQKTYYNFVKLTQTNSKIILTDYNNQFNINKFARTLAKNNQKIKIIHIQHHIAHAFSCGLEHNLKDFIAIVCDGLGLGKDNTIWGGEIFHNDKRIGHLEYHNLIGGDIANKEPIRFLISILSKFLSLNEINKILKNYNKNKIKTLYQLNKLNYNTIKSSSTGRILDSASVLLKLASKNYYEGRCAMILESNSSNNNKLFIQPIITKDKNNTYILKTTPLFKFIIENKNNIKKENLANFVQLYIAEGLIEIVKRYKKENNLKNIPTTFSGGTAYNTIITSIMQKHNILLNKNIPSGDGSISLGQIAYYLWKNKNNQN